MDQIVVVVPQPFYSDRGSPIAVREVVQAYLQLGHRVDVVTFPLGEDFKAEGLRIHRARNPAGVRSIPVGFSLRKLVLDAALTVELWRRLRRGSYSVVHAVEEAAFPAAWLARQHGCHLIYDMHSRLSEGLRAAPGLGRGPLHRLAVVAEHWLLRVADVVVTSKGLGPVAQVARPGRPVFEWQFSGVLGEGCGKSPEALRTDLDIPPGAPVVLYAGTFSKYQGVDLLLDAAREVLRTVPRAVFVLVGAEPRELEMALAAVARLELGKQVRLLPRQPREAIPDYFRLASVLVSPRTTGDNIPLKVFDYLNAGQAIVATDIPPHRTVLDESTALLAPPTPSEFGAAIAAVLQDPCLAARLNEGARRYARRHLGKAVVVEQVRCIYAAATGQAQHKRVPPSGAVP
jgi:glycosyltransferase involved in cell wall biosynthesis